MRRSTSARAKVYLRKRCAEHGWFEALVYGDAQRYVEFARFNKPGTLPLTFQTEVKDGCPVYDQTKDSGVQLLGIDVRDEARSVPKDFVRDTGITYPSIYDPPGRSLLALKGYPRSVVPSTIVLDRQHRVVAVFLAALRDTELLPVVQRIAAEPQTSAEKPS